MKKVLSFFIILCVLVSSFVVNVSAAWDGPVTNSGGVNFNDFTSSTSLFNMKIYKDEGGSTEGVYGTTYEFKQIDAAHEESLVFKNSDVPMFFPNYQKSDQTGIYHYTMEFYPYTTTSTRYLRIRPDDKTTYYSVLRFNNDGKLECYEFANGVSDDYSVYSRKYALGNYKANAWYKVDLYVDVGNDKYDLVVYEDGVLFASADDITLKDYGYGSERFKIIQQSGDTTAASGADLFAIDNVFVEKYADNKPAYTTNLVSGIYADVDSNISLNFENAVTSAEAVVKDATVGAAITAPVTISDSTVTIAPENLVKNKKYFMAVTVEISGVKYTYTIAFTAVDVKNVYTYDFTDGNIANGLVTPEKDGTFNMTFSVLDSGDDKYGNALKIVPATSGVNADLNLSVPDSITDTTVVIEYDMKESQIDCVRGNAKLVDNNVTTIVQESVKNEIKVFNGDNKAADNADVLLRVNRQTAGSFNHYSFVITVNSAGNATSYSYYVNGVALERNKTSYTGLTTENIVFAKNVPTSFKKLVLQLWTNSGVTETDYVMYDNIKVSYIDKVPSDFKVMIGDNAYVPGTSAALAAGNVLSVDMDNLIYPNAKVIYAFYNADGSLAKVDCENKTYTMTADDITNNYSIKVMLWKGLDNLIPLVSCVTVK